MTVQLHSISGTLAHIADFDRLYVNLDSEATDLMILQQQVETCSTHVEPTVGMLCAARYEGYLYRARCIRANRQDALMHFIDYGNTERVPIDQIYALPDGPLRARPPLVRCCSLEGLLAIDEDAARQEISRIALERPVTLRISKIDGLIESTGEAAIVAEDMLDDTGKSVSERLLELRLVRRYKPARPSLESFAELKIVNSETAPPCVEEQAKPLVNKFQQSALSTYESKLPSNETKVPSNETKGPSNGNIPPSNETKGHSNENIPPGNEFKEPGNENIPLSNETKGSSNGNIQPSNECKGHSNENIPPSNKNLPPINNTRPLRNEAKPAMNAGKSIYIGAVTITEVLSPNEFFCILPNAPPPPVLPLSPREPIGLTSLAELDEFDLNALYVARYSRDPTRRYHRVRLLSLNLRNATATVLLVDFGHVESSKPLAEIYQIRQSDVALTPLMAAAARATRCGLRGLATCPPCLAGEASRLFRQFVNSPDSTGIDVGSSVAFAELYAPVANCSVTHPADLHCYGSAEGPSVAEQLIASGISKPI